TRMRVSMKRNGTPTSCETFSYGEVKDYSIKIAPASGLKNAVAEIPVEMKLYPNPASQKLTILLDESMTGSTYEVFNSLGMKLTSGIVENSTTTLDLSGYTPGLYLITVESSGVLMKDKFIKR
ncbi:MAG TPA: T9SS type A sorting domain-containing protein, partial [Prolixibacteraceae bacterium]|nr:T9SS type A sorting domain-containing protein [Prolixibacteraceae bacterium]